MLFHCQTLILPIITAIIVEMPDSILVVKVGSVLNTNPTTINATMNRINLITYYSHMFDIIIFSTELLLMYLLMRSKATRHTPLF